MTSGLAVQPAPFESSRSGSYLVTAGLVGQALSDHWSAVGVPVPLDRIFLAVGLLWCVVSFHRKGGRLPVRIIHVLIVLASAWATISALSVGSLLGYSFFALVDRFGFGLFVVFALAPVVYANERSRTALRRSFTLVGCYLGATALAQMLDLTSLVWPGYILDPDVGIHAERARGPYVEAVANGLMMVYCSAFAALTLRVEVSRWGRWIALVCLPLCAFGVILTLTRAVWLGAAAAFLITVVTVQHYRRFLIPVVLAAAAAIAVLYYVLPADLVDGASARGVDKLPVWDRLNSNAAALRMIENFPLTGVGWQESKHRMVEFIRQGATYPVTSAAGTIEVHNVFLSRLAELGIPGFVLWLLTFWVAVVALPLLRRPVDNSFAAWRPMLLALVVAWTSAAMLSPISYSQPNYVLWCVAGILSSDHLVRRVASGEGSAPQQKERSTAEGQYGG